MGFCRLFICMVNKLLYSLFLDCWPVVDRRLLTFLASPRKCKQKKATAFAALRVPACAGQKMGSVHNSPSAQTRTLLFPFSALHNRQLISGIRNSKAASTSTSTLKLPKLVGWVRRSRNPPLTVRSIQSQLLLMLQQRRQIFPRHAFRIRRHFFRRAARQNQATTSTTFRP